MAINESGRYPTAKLFEGKESGNVLYAMTMQYLQTLAIDPTSSVGESILRSVASDCRDLKSLNSTIIGTFPVAITNGQLKNNPFTCIPNSPWASTTPETIIEDHLNPKIEGGDLYTFSVVYGSVNNLPVTRYITTHGPRSQSYFVSNSAEQTNQQAANGKFIEWATPMRVVARGTKGIEGRRFAIATP